MKLTEEFVKSNDLILNEGSISMPYSLFFCHSQIKKKIKQEVLTKSP